MHGSSDHVSATPPPAGEWRGTDSSTGNAHAFGHVAQSERLADLVPGLRSLADPRRQSLVFQTISADRAGETRRQVLLASTGGLSGDFTITISGSSRVEGTDQCAQYKDLVAHKPIIFCVSFGTTHPLYVHRCCAMLRAVGMQKAPRAHR